MTRDNHDTRRMFRLRGMLLNSVVESRSRVTSPRGDEQDEKTRRRPLSPVDSRLRAGSFLRGARCASFPGPGNDIRTSRSFPHEQKSAAYRETLLRIQKQIESGSLDAASAQIAEAFKAYPADGGLYNLLGVVQSSRGIQSEARRSFTAAIRHDPRLTGAYLNLSRMDMESAATDPAARSEALRLTEKVLTAEPANDEANYQVATILAWEQNYQGSLEHLQKLSAHARGQVGAQALLCAASAGLGHREETDRAVAALIANS